MARTPSFPPRITTVRGQSRCYAEGRYHYLGPPGSDQAKAAYAALCARLSNPAAPPPPVTAATLTVAGVVVRFLDHAAAHYSERGRELENFRLSVRPLLALHGDTAAGAFGPRALREVQAAMAAGSWEGAPEGGWCRNVTNRRVVRLRTLWRWAESEELAPAGSTAALLTVPGLPRNARGVRHTARRQPTSWEDLQAVLPHCPPPVQAMLEIQFLTGCRSQDVRLMTAAAISTDGPTVDGVAVWIYTPEIDKGDWREGADLAPRSIPLGPECQRLLIDWVEAYPGSLAGYLFAPVRHRRVQGCYSCFAYSQAVRRACAKAGVKIVPYGSRHAARMTVGKEMGDEAARAFLGHKTISTVTLYGNRDLQSAAEVAARLG